MVNPRTHSWQCRKRRRFSTGFMRDFPKVSSLTKKGFSDKESNLAHNCTGISDDWKQSMNIDLIFSCSFIRCYPQFLRNLQRTSNSSAGECAFPFNSYIKKYSNEIHKGVRGFHDKQYTWKPKTVNDQVKISRFQPWLWLPFTNVVLTSSTVHPICQTLSPSNNLLFHNVNGKKGVKQRFHCNDIMDMFNSCLPVLPQVFQSTADVPEKMCRVEKGPEK